MFTKIVHFVLYIQARFFFHSIDLKLMMTLTMRIRKLYLQEFHFSYVH